MSPTTVACSQLCLAVGDHRGNRDKTCRAVESAAAAGADLVVLPELANSGYAFDSAAEARALAEPCDGPTVSAWRALARRLGVVVVGGFCELDGHGVVRNSAAVVDDSGLRAIYRKVHLWDREKLVFTAGDDPPPLVTTAVGRLSVLICYDLEIPEWVRLAGLTGAELLCVPTNWPRLPRPAGERPIEVVRAQACAAVNRLFIAACDRVGAERELDWVGASVILDPDGWPLAGPAKAQATRLIARCDLGQARDKAISPRNDVHADRRPELYQSLGEAIDENKDRNFDDSS